MYGKLPLLGFVTSRHCHCHMLKNLPPILFLSLVLLPSLLFRLPADCSRQGYGCPHQHQHLHHHPSTSTLLTLPCASKLANPDEFMLIWSQQPPQLPFVCTCAIPRPRPPLTECRSHRFTRRNHHRERGAEREDRGRSRPCHNHLVLQDSGWEMKALCLCLYL